MIPQHTKKLCRHHNALSIHHVHEAVATKVIALYHTDGVQNTINIILSKHWGYQQIGMSSSLSYASKVTQLSCLRRIDCS